MPEFRTLVVEDHQDLRRFLRSTLQKQTWCRIVDEASDGLQAVQDAEKLQPDLVLLDLTLPKLNGMEAARRIRKLSPKSKIIFLSQDSSPEIVQAALGLGALGYLLKSDAAELSIAIEAVLRGEQFVSSRLKGPSALRDYHAARLPRING